MGGAIAHQDNYEFLSLSVSDRNEWANIIEKHSEYYKESKWLSRVLLFP